MAEYQTLGSALVASRRKILVFLSVVVMIVLILGTLMYLVEGPANGFNSIPTEMTAQHQTRSPTTTRTCQECRTEGHAPQALHCLHCGARLPPYLHGD